jgi:hypothetical protein
MKSPAWTAGYHDGYDTYAAGSVKAIITPYEHQFPRGDFISGFLCGARCAADDAIINDLKLDLK